MNKETCAPEVGTNAFVEGIYSIIDSKIQYLDYQTRELLRPLIGENTTKELKSIGEKNQRDIKIVEQWFLAFEKFSRIKKILLLLKHYLNKDKENQEKAVLVLSLLADDLFIKLSQKDLEYRLGINQRYQAA